MKNDLEEKVKILREIKFKEEANEVLRLKRKKDKLLEKIHKIRMEPENVLPYLGMGRLVHVSKIRTLMAFDYYNIYYQILDQVQQQRLWMGDDNRNSE